MGVGGSDPQPGTIVPQPNGLAATFDTDLLRRVATVISTELRATSNHERKTQNVTRQVQAIILLCLQCSPACSSMLPESAALRKGVTDSFLKSLQCHGTS